jgi:pimeloyl-ACP methyl ester carboxylesterase
VAAGLSSVESVEVEVWEETGHFPLLEDPVRFNRRLEAFLLRCLTQGSAT